jgi:peroxiredoxin
MWYIFGKWVSRRRERMHMAMMEPGAQRDGEPQNPHALFQNKIFTAIFGHNTTSLVTRLTVIALCVGTLLIIALGLLSPNAPAVPAVASYNGSQTLVGLHVGDAAPNFTLATLNGKRVSLSDYRGQPVLLNFWYASCPGCEVETPDMQRFYAAQHAAGKNLVILGVNTIDDVPTAQQFVRQHGLTYQVVLDNHQTVSTLYNLEGTPTSYFIDRQGIIRSVVVGPVDSAMLQQDVAVLH